MDIDSDNTARFAAPDRSPDEDDRENKEGSKDHPGKIILLNDGDADDDGVPDFADGFDKFENEGANASAQFVPLVLSIPESSLGKKVKFTYSASDPSKLEREGDEVSGYRFIPASGSLRIWTKDGPDSRKSAAVADDGDFVASEVEYDADDLGFGGDEQKTTVTFYIEGIKVSQSLGDQSISVAVGHESDTVKVVVFGSRLVRIDESGSAADADNRLLPSHPSPVIQIQQCTFENVRASGDKSRILADIRVKGSVSSSICDLVPGSEGTVQEVNVYLNGSTDPIAVVPTVVSKSGGGSSFLKPFPFSATFEAATIPNVEVSDGTNTLLLTATDKVPNFGVTGYSEWSLEVVSSMPEKKVPLATLQITLPPGGLSVEAIDAIAVTVTRGSERIEGELVETAVNSRNFGISSFGVRLGLGLSMATVYWPDGGFEGINFNLTPTGSGNPQVYTGTLTRPMEDWEMPDWEDWSLSAEASSLIRASSEGEPSNYAIQLTGPADFFELIDEVDWAGKTRKIIQGPDDNYYIAADDENRPAVFQPVAVEPPSEPSFSNDELDGWNFTKGFARGFWDGGVSLVEGAIELITSTIKVGLRYNPIALVYRMASGDTFETEKRFFAGTIKVIKIAADVMLAIRQAQQETIEALMAGDWEIIADLSLPFQIAFEVGAELFEALLLELSNATDEEKGYYTGRAALEAVTLVIAQVKIAQLSKLEYLTKFRSLKIFSSGPGAGAFQRIDDLILFLTRWSDCCFVAGTKVHTRNGLVAIENIQSGDEVLAADPRTHKRQYKRVLGTLTTKPSSLFEIAFGAEALICTGEHPLHVAARGGFIRAETLRMGDKVTSLTSPLEVLDIQPCTTEYSATYNLRIEEFPNYFVSEAGVWAHNAGPPSAPCARIAALYFRYKTKSGLDGAQAWAKIEGKKWARMHIDVMGAALERVVREELFGGDTAAKIWAANGIKKTAAQRMIKHYDDHVLGKKSPYPGGEFPHLKGNAFLYVKEALEFSRMPEGPDIATWTDNALDHIVMSKTPPHRYSVVAGAYDVQNAGALRSYYLRDPLKFVTQANPAQQLSPWEWAKANGYKGPAF